MEIAITPDMPTYSGGLGVLAGDTMRSAADLGLGTMRRHAYCIAKDISTSISIRTRGSDRGRSALAAGKISRSLREALVEVTIEDRPVMVRAWRYDLVKE